MAIRRLLPLIALIVAALGVSACQESDIPKDIRPVSYALTSRMESLGMKETSPVLIRIFKEESALEVWKQTDSGKYALLKTYSICKWSGGLGPKVTEGDRQAPEGFYTVTPGQMNPASHYYLAFNIGYPNAYDRALGHTGSNLMVHGACSSSGCYSMTDADAGELFALARDAFRGGQTSFQIEAFPFRMTPENMARHRNDPNMPFWRMLKVGYDHFEVTRRVPTVDVCNKTYVFDGDPGNASFRPSEACPAYKIPDDIKTAVDAKEAADAQQYDVAVTKLQAKAQRDAEAEQRAADQAAHPSILARWFGHKPVEPPAATSVATPPSPSAAADTSTSLKVAVAPVPRPKPISQPAVSVDAVKLAKTEPRLKDKDKTAKVVPASAVTEPAAPAPVTPAAPRPDTSTTDAGSAQPKVGTVVNRKFLWPDDDEPAIAGSTPIVPPTLDTPAN